VQKYKKLLWSPSVLGVMFVITSVIDIQLFELQKITPQQMFVSEFAIFLVGVVCTFLVFIAGVVLAFKKHWKHCGVSALSVVIFFVCVCIAVRNGVAVVYAT
jgi:hypothetical protein